MRISESFFFKWTKTSTNSACFFRGFFLLMLFFSSSVYSSHWHYVSLNVSPNIENATDPDGALFVCVLSSQYEGVNPFDQHITNWRETPFDWKMDLDCNFTDGLGTRTAYEHAVCHDEDHSIMFSGDPVGCPVESPVFPSNLSISFEKQLGELNDCLTGCGNPIDGTIGNKYQLEVDLSGAVLTWSRHYNSGAADLDGPLGFGWSHGYNTRLDFEDADNLAMRRDSGKVVRFVRSGVLWSSDADVDPLLTENTSGYLVTQPNGTQEQYDAGGLLMFQLSPSGLQTQFGYDGNDNLDSITGPYGHTLGLTYDTNQRIETLTDSGGGLISYGYSPNGNLDTVTYADGSPDQSVRSYHYEDSSDEHALTGITDGNDDRFATWGYDADGNANLSEHGVTTNGVGQEQVSLSYDTANKITTVTDAAGQQEQISFEINLGMRNLTSRVFTADGKGVVQTFDANNNLESRTDAEGNTTLYTYNAFNQRTSMTEASGETESRLTTYTYLSDDLDLQKTITRDGVTGPQTHLTTLDYDDPLNPTLVTGFTEEGFDNLGTPVSRHTRFEYDADGRLELVDGPRTDLVDETNFTYYDCSSGGECGQLKSIINALGQMVTYDSYNAHGQLTQLTSVNGVVSVFDYDDRQRLDFSSIAGRNTSYEYDDAGQLEKVIQPDGITFTYGYDAAHDLRSVTDNLGQKTEYLYDSRGDLTDSVTRNADTTVVATQVRGYDLRSRVNQVNNGTGVTDWGLDALGNPDTVTDPRGKVTINDHDALNQLTTSQDPLTAVTSQQYDPAGRIIQITSDIGAVTDYSYDDLNNLLSEQSPDRGTLQYQYDPAGNLTQLTDGRNITVIYSYDELNRVISADYPGSNEDITYHYDTGTGCNNGVGRLCQITDQTGTTRYDYDSFGNVTSVERLNAGVTYTTGYGYDAGDRVTSITYPTGLVVTYSRDALGRTTQVSSDQHGTILNNITYRATGQIDSRDFANGLSESRGYDLTGRLTGQNIGSTAITYGYDAAGNLTLWHNPDETSNFEAETNASNTYVPNSNRLDTIDANPVSLDAAGNTQSTVDRTHTYDQQGYLSLTTQLQTGVQSQNSANAMAQRISKVITDSGSVETIFYHYNLAGQLIAETDETGAMIRNYVWLGDEPVAQDGPAHGGLVYLHSDHLNTPRFATNSAGDRVWSWQSTAFGLVSPDEDPDGDSQLTQVNLRFPGQYFDEETGLHYNWNRYYDPGAGRYITSDPIGLSGGTNTYGYVGGNPLLWIDSTGLWSFGIEAFWYGIGGGFVLGENPDGSSFITGKAGAGFGGAISYDPNGKSPGYDSCDANKSFTSAGSELAVGLGIGPLNGGYSSSRGKRRDEWESEVSYSNSGFTRSYSLDGKWELRFAGSFTYQKTSSAIPLIILAGE